VDDDDVGLHDYRFRSTWLMSATPEEVFRALRDVEDYPHWWPQVVRAERYDDDTAGGAVEAYDMVVRSLLPYDLAFRSATTRDDEAAGVLEAGSPATSTASRAGPCERPTTGRCSCSRRRSSPARSCCDASPWSRGRRSRPTTR
jgi:hypothetical protein